MERSAFLVIIVFSIGIILRFYNLGEVPVSLHRDEAFLGYNAYSILKTGKDMSGNFLPIHLESFFFSPAGYSYFSIPFIALFGLSQFSIRFASALFGSLNILLIFFIVLNLFAKNKNKYVIGLFSSFIFAISPWHINLSRVAVESTIVLFFISLGILLYLKYIKENKIHLLVLSFIYFAVTFLVYQAPRAFLPLFIPFLAISLSGVRKIVKDKYQILLFLVLIIGPVLFIVFSPDLSLRIQSLSIFSHPETQLIINEQRTQDYISGVPTIISRLFHNKAEGYSLSFLSNYFKHFSFDFLFLDGGFPDRFRIPRTGLIYIFELPLILIALFMLYKKEIKNGIFLSGWILISFVGSALTFDDIPNLQRAFIAIPAFSIFSGYGIFSFIEVFNSKKIYKKIVLGIISTIIIYSFSYYMIQYYVQGKIYRPWYRQGGYRVLVSQVNDLLPNYDKAVITNRESAPTIFFLFYS